MSGLGRVTVRGKAQAMTAVSSCSRAFAALHIIMSHVDLKKRRGISGKNWTKKTKLGLLLDGSIAHVHLSPPPLLYLLVKATQITAINKVHV